MTSYTDKIEIQRLKNLESQSASDLEAMTQLYELGNQLAQSDRKLDDCLRSILTLAIEFTQAESGEIELSGLEFVGTTIKIVYGPGHDRPIPDAGVTKKCLTNNQGAKIGSISTYSTNTFEPTEKSLRLMDLLSQMTSYYIERKRVDHALQESEERLKSLADHTPTMVWVTEKNNKCSYLSKSWYEFTGNETGIGLGREWVNSIHPDDLESFRLASSEFRNQQRPYQLEYRLRRASGEYHTVLEVAAPRFCEQNEFLGYVGSVIDIEGHHQLEAKLQQSESYLRAIIEQLPAGVGVYDETGEWTQMNSLMEQYVPRNVPFTLLDQSQFWQAWDEQGITVPPDNWPAHRALRGERVFPGVEMLYADPKRGDVWMRVSTSPLYSDTGKVVGACAVIQDISKVKQAEHSLRDIDRRKNQFLATLAHELRNPLAPIRNGLHLLHTDCGLSDSSVDVVDMMESQINHMVRLVDDLLEVSRISRGNIEMRKQSTDLSLVLHNAIDISKPLINSAGHHLEINFPDKQLTVNADPVRLAQVFSNLLNNAAKYTDEGGKISVTVIDDLDKATISILDNGIGMSEEFIPTVFDVFTQADGSSKRAQGGLGIGLTLAHKLIEMHSGSVSVHSEGPGKGSEFIITLPLVTSSTVAASPSPVQLCEIPHKILIVDDNHEAGDTLGLILEMKGSEIRIAHDGNEALNEAIAFAPDVILLDIGLPDINGYEVAQRIRTLPQLKDVVIIAVTGWGQQDDRRKSKESGFNYHLVKPVEIDALEKLLHLIKQETDNLSVA